MDKALFHNHSFGIPEAAGKYPVGMKTFICTGRLSFWRKSETGRIWGCSMCTWTGEGSIDVAGEMRWHKATDTGRAVRD